MWPTFLLEPALSTPPFGRSHFLLIIRNCIPVLIILIVSSFQNRTLALEKNSLETQTGILNHPYLFNKSFHENPSLHCSVGGGALEELSKDFVLNTWASERNAQKEMRSPPDLRQSIIAGFPLL